MIQAQDRRDSALRSLVHRLLSVIAAVSLVLCVATAVAWPLSFGPLEGDHHGTKRVFLSEGKLWFGPSFPGGEGFRSFEGWNITIASWYSIQGVRGGQWTSSHIELWLIVAAFGVLPAVHYRVDRPVGRIWRKRRARLGCCPTCGYDLRGTSEKGTCPECGTPKSAIASELKALEVSEAVSAPAAVVGFALCTSLIVLWALSFDLLKGDHRGVVQVFIADGKLWVGPLLRGGEEAARASSWDIGVVFWARCEGVWGGQWTSFGIELWCFIVLTGMLPAIRYRLIHYVRERIRNTARGNGDITQGETGTQRETGTSLISARSGSFDSD